MTSHSTLLCWFPLFTTITAMALAGDAKPVPADILQADEEEAKAVEELKGLKVSCIQLIGKKWDVSLQKGHVTEKGLIKPEVAGPLQKLRGIRQFSADFVQLSDAGLETIKGLPGLESLNVSSNDITDAGLVHLKGLSQLR